MTGPRAICSLHFTSYVPKFVVIWTLNLELLCSLASATCPNTLCGAIAVDFPFSSNDDGQCSDPGYQLNCTTYYLSINLGSSSYSINYINYTAHIIGLEGLTQNCTTPFESNATYSLRLGTVTCVPEQGTAVPGQRLKAEFQVQFVDPSDRTACEACLETMGTCAYDSTPALYCIPPAPSPSPLSDYCRGSTCISKSSKNTGLTVGLSVGASVLAMGLLGAFFLFLRKRRTIAIINNDPSGINQDPAEEKTMTQRLHAEGTTLFTYRELATATDSFSESRLLGSGGFSSVYKGVLSNGQTVAVKKLNQWNKQLLDQFLNEVAILSKVQHPSLVQLLGCCLESRGSLLVLEFIPNGTLAQHLHGNAAKGKQRLSWATRLRIAVEIAHAMAYLHEGISPPILHRDIKSTNILLDEDFHAKVGDFGLSRLFPREATHIYTAPQGTFGYLDPVYNETYQLTDKSDVYSFGVLLMEIISGKKAVDLSRESAEINLAPFAMAKIQSGSIKEMIDPSMGSHESNGGVEEEMVSSVAEVALGCLSAKREDRPCMREVAEMLHLILLQQQTSSS